MPNPNALEKRGGGAQVFVDAMQQPASAQEARRWQEANRRWWADSPMSYDWNRDIGYAESSEEFFREVDRRFFGAVRRFMPWRDLPFDPLIDFRALERQDVLEIGVGSGSHAQLIAERARSYTGIDITEQAVERTSRRLERRGIDARILPMDAEEMSFEDHSFDYVWSWGVVHHSADTHRILEQMHRVLRPGGAATIMVYHSNFWNRVVIAGLFHGLLRGKLLRTRSLTRIRKSVTDGSIARFYTAGQWRTLVQDLFSVEEIRVYGQVTDLIPLPAGTFKDQVVRRFPDRLARFLTNKCRMGSLLVSRLRRRERGPAPERNGLTQEHRSAARCVSIGNGSRDLGAQRGTKNKSPGV